MLDTISRIDTYLDLYEQAHKEKLASKTVEEQQMLHEKIAYFEQNFNPSCPQKMLKMLRSFLDSPQGGYDSGDLLQHFFSFDVEEDYLSQMAPAILMEVFSNKISQMNHLPDEFLNPCVGFYRNRLQLIVTDRADYIISPSEEALLCQAVSNIFQFFLAKELFLSNLDGKSLIDSFHLLLESTFLSTHQLKYIENWIRLYQEGRFISKQDPFFKKGKEMIRSWYLQHRFPITPWYFWINEMMYVFDEIEFERVRINILVRLIEKANLVMNSNWKNGSDGYSELKAIKEKLFEIENKTLKKDE